jgi:hypothetical protein
LTKRGGAAESFPFLNVAEKVLIALQKKEKNEEM